MASGNLCDPEEQAISVKKEEAKKVEMCAVNEAPHRLQSVFYE